MGKPVTSKKVARVSVQKVGTEDSLLRDEGGALMSHLRLFAIMAAVVNGHRGRAGAPEGHPGCARRARFCPTGECYT